MSRLLLFITIVWAAIVGVGVGYLINTLHVDREQARLDLTVYELKHEIRILETQLEAQEFANQK